MTGRSRRSMLMVILQLCCCHRWSVGAVIALGSALSVAISSAVPLPRSTVRRWTATDRLLEGLENAFSGACNAMPKMA
jgi:hypothetical protein